MPVVLTKDLLTAAQWRPRAAAHADRVDAWTAGHRDRASRREPHPVEDFLFTYYSHRPGQLRRWHPGADVVLLGADDRLSWRFHREVSVDGAVGVGLDLPAFLRARRDAVIRIRDLLAATAARPAQLGCFGLHEWAMVYREPAIRHADWPLRLGADGTDAVVRSAKLRCTHHDAVRFFTPDALPLLPLVPTRQDQVDLEQPGCLHATMDLYKWAYQLAPAVPGELVADCFALAREVRTLDMRASPYDLTGLGYEPVPVETPAGRTAYVEAQRDFTARAAPLRARLIEVCDALLGQGAG